MINKLILTVAGILTFNMISLGTVLAATPTCQPGQKYDKDINLCITPIDKGDLPDAKASETNLKKILSIVIGILGAITFLMVIVSGFRYVISNGEPERIAKARSALIYSLLGLVIAITAQAIVSFVVGRL